MNIIADFHTHSLYSDGRDTLANNVAAAHAKGLKAIALTDHGMGQISSGMDRKLLPEYRAQVDKLNAEYAGEIKVLMGIEANLLSLDGQIDVDEQTRPFFDVILMGYHKTARPARLADKWHFWVRNLLLRNTDTEAARRKTTQAYINAVEKNDISIVVHPCHSIKLDLVPLARACAARHTAIEISARHKHLEYTSADAQAMKREGAFFVVDSDGHHPTEIGVFDQALRFCDDSTLTNHDIINAQGYDGALPKALQPVLSSI